MTDDVTVPLGPRTLTLPAIMFTFTGWRLSVFGLALILMMRFRPEGIIPSSRVKHELHPDELVTDPVEPLAVYRSGADNPAYKRGPA